MPTLPIRGAYTDNWPAVARARKDGADWRCVRCDHEHDPTAGYCLTVHHFDGDKGNMEPWNLMALCQRCHLNIQGRVNPSISLMFKPSYWAMPYIAGYYEAGNGIPGPHYDLERWILTYITFFDRPWPWWAPVPAGQ